MGGPGSGNHKPGRRRQAAELRAQGLTLPEIGRRMGCSKQAVHYLLGLRGPAPRPPKPVACPACGTDLGPAPSALDYAPPLCLPCLSKRPRTPLGQRLRAHRIARGLSRQALAERAGVGPAGITQMERGARQPRPRAMRKLAQALGVEAEELLPGRKGGAGVAPL
jgi:transcriptional regulator with XRE-family HTH domain